MTELISRLKRTDGTGSSAVVDRCQVCDSEKLQSIAFIGYLPPVNTMRPIGQQPHEEKSYPAQLLQCKTCSLTQIGLIVDPNVLFPPEYPYTSGTTRILRENFAELHKECVSMLPFKADDLIVDIGSNDGTLLSNFKKGGFRVLGIEPTLMANLANERGIQSIMSFFNADSAAAAIEKEGKASIVTATNVFAHIEYVHEIVGSILSLLKDDGVFISESHYLGGLIETLQYDTIYHEHLRYYSLKSLRYLFDKNGLEIIHVKKIPTHGGSIRVYTARKGKHPIQSSVQNLLSEEADKGVNDSALTSFKQRMVDSKLSLFSLIRPIKAAGERIYGIGAPSRASTLIHYAGLDDGVLDCVLEIKGSYKIGKYMPGTLISVEEEGRLYEDQPEYAMLLSWHIADELIPKIKQNGYKGKFIVPLPEPHIVA